MSDEAREKRWRRELAMIADEIGNGGEADNLDTCDDPRVLRDCLIRQRLAAAAERQSHEARAVVFDIQFVDREDGVRCIRVVSTSPVGDRAEQREAAVMALAAWHMALADFSDAKKRSDEEQAGDGA